jgi:hypothetical protein
MMCGAATEGDPMAGTGHVRGGIMKVNREIITWGVTRIPSEQPQNLIFFWRCNLFRNTVSATTSSSENRNA